MIKEYNNGWMTDFPGHRHEDDTDTGKSGISVQTSFCRPCCARMETWCGEQNKIFKKRKKQLISKEAVRNSLGHFKGHFGSQISWKSIKWAHMYQTKPKLATKLGLITVCQGWIISTWLIVLLTSALRNMHMVTQKLDPDQIPVVHTHIGTLPGSIKLYFFPFNFVANFSFIPLCCWEGELGCNTQAYYNIRPSWLILTAPADWGLVLDFYLFFIAHTMYQVLIVSTV